MAATFAVLSATLAVIGGDGGPRGIEAASAPQAVAAQFAEEADTVFVAPIDDPSSSREFVTIEHAPGWGIIGAVSPNGRWLAYTVLPAGGSSPQKQAVAHLLSLTSGEDRVVADGVDLQVAPTWSGGSDRVAFVRGAAAADELGSFSVLVARIAGRVDEAGTIGPALAAHPVGFAANGAVYVAVVDPTGTWVEAVGGRREILARLSDGLARDFALSPDGLKLAFVDTSPSAGAAFRVRVIDLAGEFGSSAVTPGDAALGPGDVTLGPAWTPQGDLTYSTASRGEPAVRLDGAALATSAARPVGGESSDGFDIPLAWSPDGAALAVQAVTGALGDVKALRLGLISGDGARRLFGTTDTKFLGWVPAGVGR